MYRVPALLLLFALGCSPLAAQSKSLEVSLGWNYALDDQGNGFANVNGWYGTVNWPVFHRVGLAFSHESYWGAYRGPEIGQHVYLLGTTLKLRHGEHKVNPFVQPFGGDTRVSYAGDIEDQPTFELAGGVDIRLKGKWSLELIPAEYAYAHGSIGSLNTYQAAAGFEYTFGK